MSLVYEHLLKKISPVWYEHLKKFEAKNPDFKSFGCTPLEMEIFNHQDKVYCLTSSKCCVVGEAHNLNGEYYYKCDECRDFCFSLFHVSNWKEFWEDRQMFAEHFIEAHNK